MIIAFQEMHSPRSNLLSREQQQIITATTARATTTTSTATTATTTPTTAKATTTPTTTTRSRQLPTSGFVHDSPQRVHFQTSCAIALRSQPKSMKNEVWQRPKTNSNANFTRRRKLDSRMGTQLLSFETTPKCITDALEIHPKGV